MSEPEMNEDPLQNMSREEMMSALFGHLVIQNTNMALMFLGKVPNPQTGESMYEIEPAKMFIDQLEMLEVKTKGNLSREEEKLLQQSLMHLRMSFVEALENPPNDEPVAPDHEKRIEPETESKPATEAANAQAAADEEAEARKKFTKKY
jgi:hypothetical protein